MSTTTKLGIITNYKDDILNGENIKNPIQIELKRWFGITDNSTEFIQENVKGQGISLIGQTPEQFLDTYFKGKFETFNKLSTDSTPKKNLDSPWYNNFDASNLIVLYLEVKKDDNKWHTVKNSDGKNYNRIYLFGEDGKEVRTKNVNMTAFYEIIIQNNNLTLTKDGVKVTFELTEIAMTLAKLINKLLGTDITYNDENVPAQERKLTGELRASDPSPTGDSTGGPAALPLPPTTEETARPLQPPPTTARQRPQFGEGEESSGESSGGKKSRKKQRKGGKKSRKQRKSMRKNKRSRSKK
jgi:hypothetical protein